MTFIKKRDGYVMVKKHSSTDINKAEDELNYHFPFPYKQFLMEEGSGYFALQHNPVLPRGSSLQEFFSLVTVRKMVQQNEVPEGYIPFGADGGGSLYFIHKQNGKVYYLDNSFDEIEEVCESFDLFIMLLATEEES